MARICLWRKNGWSNVVLLKQETGRRSYIARTVERAGGKVHWGKVVASRAVLRVEFALPGDWGEKLPLYRSHAHARARTLGRSKSTYHVFAIKVELIHLDAAYLRAADVRHP
jgi:beta-galactosidase/beta-glucuronidase